MIPERLRPLLAETRPLAERFAAAGHRLYLVGGTIRDLFLERQVEPSEFDLTTDAHPADVKRILDGWADTVWTVGERFGTIGARRGGREYEITTHRAEVYRPDSRKPDVEFAEQIEADLARRDFTVNAMALALPEPELIDPFSGVADLAAGRLRTPLSPEESFSDDPLRMMRAARFVSGYGLTPDHDLVDAVHRLRHRLGIVSAERIRDELNKLLVVEDPSAGLWFLHDTGLFGEFLPEIPALRLEQDPIHRHKDVLAHTIAVVARVGPRTHDGLSNLVTRLAALLHDIGKPKTRSIGPHGVSFHHHEVEGARMARHRLTELRYSSGVIDAVTRLVFLHLRFHGYAEGDGGWTDAAVRRYVRDAGDLLAELNELTKSDCTTRNERRARQLAERMEALESRIDGLKQREELARIRPDLNGDQVMAHLGLTPGPMVGEAMRFLLDLRLDEGPLGEAEAYRRLDEWWRVGHDATMHSP